MRAVAERQAADRAGQRNADRRADKDGGKKAEGHGIAENLRLDAERVIAA
ncbi:hypothetical protein [Mesorhizobium carmichaelinearum]|nr:hypothetical protein [Mesorhizobium carmichaelinearum]